jgi:hypothetical protein
MVSDAMVKMIFLSMPVFPGYFPFRKGSFAIFFTVKHIFHKIKLWLATAGRIGKERDGFEYEKD